jgi:error-prone DNA polymerase
VLRNTDLKSMRNGRRTAVSGLVLVRQRPSTAKGIIFITLEDETGVANLIIRPHTWERYRSVARAAPALIAEGVVERQGEVIHVMVNRLHDLAACVVDVRGRFQPNSPERAAAAPCSTDADVIRDIGGRSRDFH